MLFRSAYIFRVAAVNAIGTGSYSSNSSSFTPASHDNGAMFPLGSYTVSSSGASYIEFTSIPSTYNHLVIKGILRSNRSTEVNDSMYITCNGVGGTSYAFHALNGDGSSASADRGFTRGNIFVSYGISAAGASSNVYSGIVIDVLDYANTNKTKTFKILGGVDNNGSGAVTFSSGLFNSTNAISSIKIAPAYGTLLQYSTLSLYGVKSQ